jgi:predicted Zn-dependent protease
LVLPQPSGAGARAHVELRGAERQLRELARVETSTSSLVNLARVLALQERWQEASRLVNQALLREPQRPGLLDLRATLDDGMRLPPPQTQRDATAPDAAPGAEQADSVVRAGIERARVTLELTGPEAARRVIDRHLAAYPQDAHLVVARAVLDVVDGQPNLAQQRLRQAQVADPRRASIWEAAQERLTPAGTPQRPLRQMRLP